MFKARPFCRSCAKCCYQTEMLLLNHDIRRITKLGYELRDFAVKREGLYYLKNAGGHCVFLDVKSKLCKIYRWRPLGCRLYPIVYYVDEGRIGVDPECPLAHDVSPHEVALAEVVIRRLVLNELRRSALGCG